jgi:hypothetical protein
VASLLFAILIFIYAFIFIIYNPMTEKKIIIQKNSDVQMQYEKPIQPSENNVTQQNNTSSSEIQQSV